MNIQTIFFTQKSKESILCFQWFENFVSSDFILSLEIRKEKIEPKLSYSSSHVIVFCALNAITKRKESVGSKIL